jgi:hypothetical protein
MANFSILVDSRRRRRARLDRGGVCPVPGSGATLAAPMGPATPTSLVNTRAWPLVGREDQLEHDHAGGL